MAVGEALAARAMTAADNRRIGPLTPAAGDPVQVVIKGISRIKAKASVGRALRYIGRLREEDEENGIFGSVALYDQAGREAGRDVSEMVRSWRLKEDSENVSSLAKAAREHAGVLEENEALRENQAIHFTWSGGPGVTPEQLRIVTLEVLDEYMAQDGFPAFFGIHTEHLASEDEPAETKPHVHILVRARSENGKRLTVGKNLLTALRHSLAARGRTVGMNVTAEAREDREDVRERILDGETRLRTGRTGRGGNVEVRTPGFWSRHGKGFIARVEDLDALRAKAVAKAATLPGLDTEAARSRAVREMVSAGMEVEPKKSGLLKRVVSASRVPADVAGVAEAIQDSFHDANEAARLFREMAIEGGSQDPLNDKVWHFPNLQLAKWYMRHRPMMFGRIRRRSFGHRTSARLLTALEEFRPQPGRNEIEKLNRVDRRAHEEAAQARRDLGVRRDKARIIESHENLSRDVRSLLHADSLADKVAEVAQMTRRLPVGSPSPSTPGTPVPGPEGRRPERGRGASRGQER